MAVIPFELKLVLQFVCSLQLYYLFQCNMVLDHHLKHDTIEFAASHHNPIHSEKQNQKFVSNYDITYVMLTIILHTLYPKETALNKINVIMNTEFIVFINLFILQKH